MDSKQSVTEIIEQDEPVSAERLLDIILPPKSDKYTLEEIDESLCNFYNEVEQVQRDNNNKFDDVLDEPVHEKLRNLCQDLHKTQLDIMKLQCDIAYTREQFDTVKGVLGSKVIQERKELLKKEENLRKSIQQSKFRQVKEFFDRFIKHLDAAIATCRKLLAYYASNYLQSFDWGQYHQSLYLLRACGKTLIDLDRFERIYNSGMEIAGISFKQPIDKMDFNNYIEFQTTYSVETQAEVLLDGKNTTLRLDYGKFLLSPEIMNLMEPRHHIAYDLFKSEVEKLRSITVECCQFLVDLNLNYIEAHFTDGINIDKLNGCDTEPSMAQSSDPTLPHYAFSPQEYITQIGQHLLTLRKQTEQFDQIDNVPLKYALEFLQHAQNVSIDVSSCQSVTEIILKCIARNCVRSIIGRMTNSILSKLSPNGRRQLATDAMYLDNVLEDLGLLGPDEPNVQKFKSLLAL